MEAKIRDLAYQKWEAAGCPTTTEDERNRFWYEAEKEVLDGDSQNDPPQIKDITAEIPKKKKKKEK